MRVLFLQIKGNMRDKLKFGGNDAGIEAGDGSSDLVPRLTGTFIVCTSFYAGHEGAKKNAIIKLWRLTLVTMSVLFFGGQSLDVKRISKGGQR